MWRIIFSISFFLSCAHANAEDVLDDAGELVHFHCVDAGCGGDGSKVCYSSPIGFEIEWGQTTNSADMLRRSSGLIEPTPIIELFRYSVQTDIDNREDGSQWLYLSPPEGGRTEDHIYSIGTFSGIRLDNPKITSWGGGKHTFSLRVFRHLSSFDDLRASDIDDLIYSAGVCYIHPVEDGKSND